MAEGDLVTRTACGLWVLAGVNPRQWGNFSWTTPVVDLPGDAEDSDALALIRVELMQQIGTGTADGRYTLPDTVAFACIHAGEPERVQHPALDWTDPAVTDEEVALDEYRGQQMWTVCGVLEGTWRSCCIPTTAGTPLVGYLNAWRQARAEYGQHLLLAAVHPGHWPALPTIGFADPSARTAEEMAATAATWM